MSSRFWQEQSPDLNSMFLHAPHGEELHKAETPEILSYLPELSGKMILDLAAGIGRFTGLFAAKAKEVMAVDFTPAFIEENKQRNGQWKNIRWICADIMDLEFEERQFDFIFINWLLMGLETEEVVELIRRLRSWLKRGGQLFVRESTFWKSTRAAGKYFARYRTLPEYEELLRQGEFAILQRGHVRAFVDFYASPFQAWWLAIKE